MDINRHLKAGLGAFLLVALFLSLAPGVWGEARYAAAQSDDPNWNDPINLSQSGGAIEPEIVVDSEGRFHVLWRDEFVGFVYTTSPDGVEWSRPAIVELPSEAMKPWLFADQSGNIHAFWIGDTEEAAGFVPGANTGGGGGGSGTTEDTLDDLFHSKVKASDFANLASWSGRQLLSTNAVDLDATVDSTGRLHLFYVRAVDGIDAPAGLYYTDLANAGSNWSASTLLYQSDYFRSLTIETAHVKAAAGTLGESDHIFVAFDNQPRERIFLLKSPDGGETWGEPLEVDQPIEGTVAAGPANLLVYAQNENILLLWQTARTETSCDQYFQWSNDGGINWTARQELASGIVACPQGVQIFTGPQGPILMLPAIQVYLMAWDGSHWSDPQSQEPLTSFVDPETHKIVNFGCQRGALVNNELYIVGCDIGEVKDVWLMRRQLTDLPNWFPQDPIWNQPVSLNSNPQEMLYPAVITDASERVHVMWTQPIDPLAGVFETAIYYTRLDAGQWSVPERILSSPEGNTGPPSVALDPEGRLLVAWSGGASGEILFSQASAARASVATTWTEPVRLPMPVPVGSAPDILVDKAGKIYITYAIPLNEGRGIYLSSSSDAGVTWSDPVQIFDAVAAGWALVDEPHLALTQDDDLHVLWTRYSNPAGPGSLGLYYSRSDDGGQTWSAAEQVVEEAVVWSEIVGIGNRIINRIWQEQSGGGTTLWHEQSQDNGATWTRISPVSIFGEIIQVPSLTWDPSGRIHLLQIIDRSTDEFVLEHWVWDGERWNTDQSLQLDSETTNTVNALVAAVSAEGNLWVLFENQTGDEASGTLQNNLLLVNRKVETSAGAAEPEPLPQVTATPAPTPTATAAAEASPAPTATTEPALPTPTVNLNLAEEPGAPNSSWVSGIVGPALAGLVVFLIILAGVFMVRSGRLHL
jgi:hypothetical protein